MPELPEVETTVRELRKHIIGRTIVDLWTDWPKIAKHPASLRELASRIRNTKILDVRRRAKYIVINLEQGQDLFVHQKMSGHLLYGRWVKQGKRWTSAIEGVLKDDPKNSYLRLVLSLDNGDHIALADQRRFGTIALIRQDEPLPANIAGLGPEPLEISPSAFMQLFHNKKGKIKQTLMDPAFIAGIGNIYADEILWDAGIHPLSSMAGCAPDDMKRIYRSMRAILQKAIRYQGSSMDDYRLPSGAKGRFQDIRAAYHRHGNPCRRDDGGVIERIVINQRSAHFCPKHQLLL